MDLPYVVNGKTQQGMWRIDDLSEERTGIDFLQHPAALVGGSAEMAKHVCDAMNQWRRDQEKKE